ncbi:MAG: endonuclease III [Nitrospirae bacterium]|nr:endonuclease III [Nitrospirota bacterium]
MELQNLRKEESGEILARLAAKYPDARTALNFSTHLELLVATILSAQCTDERVNQVTSGLFGKYRTAGDFASALPELLEAEIRPTGFYRNKSKMIIEATKAIEFLHGGEVPSTMEELTALPGVGRKTASVVLGVAFGVPAIAVDTHVLRVSNRLGLVSSKDPEKVEMALSRAIPREEWINFSLRTILFGREVCKVKKPACLACFLYDLCKWPEKPAKSSLIQ